MVKKLVRQNIVFFAFFCLSCETKKLEKKPLNLLKGGKKLFIQTDI